MTDPQPADRRLAHAARRWHVNLDRVVATESSLLGFGLARDLPVVLKIAASPHDEWNAGRVLDAFDGHGMARVLEHEPGAVLMRELRPGTSLVDRIRADGDEVATSLLADVVAVMNEVTPDTAGWPTAQDWAVGFAGHATGQNDAIPREFVLHGQRTFDELAHTQGPVRLLHGDLQHSNILFDAHAGWVAIDPKGVVAEREFELGAALRNPYAMPDLYTSRAVERRAHQLAAALGLDVERLLKWTFAQAVLSALWSIEDGDVLHADAPALRVASATRALLV